MTTEELLELVLDTRQRELHTAMPGRVESYDADTQTCDVLPQLKIQRPDGEGGYTTCDLPVLPHVPVCFQRTTNFFMSFPLQKGDFVLLVFSERAIGNWRQKGEASNPGDLRMHSLAGAVAIPGVYPTSGALENADGTNMVLGADDGGDSRIEIKPSGNGINLGAGATAGVARIGDRINASAQLVAWAQSVELALSTVPNTAFAGTPFASGPATSNGLGTINEGSDKIKAVD
jgi:hypothetical protein